MHGEFNRLVTIKQIEKPWLCSVLSQSTQEAVTKLKFNNISFLLLTGAVWMACMWQPSVCLPQKQEQMKNNGESLKYYFGLGYPL